MVSGLVGLLTEATPHLGPQTLGRPALLKLPRRPWPCQSIFLASTFFFRSAKWGTFFCPSQTLTPKNSVLHQKMFFLNTKNLGKNPFFLFKSAFARSFSKKTLSSPGGVRLSGAAGRSSAATSAMGGRRLGGLGSGAMEQFLAWRARKLRFRSMSMYFVYIYIYVLCICSV